MKKVFLTVCASAAMAFAPALAAAPRVDAPAPTFTAVTAAGETITSDDFTAKMVVLEWTNHDCPFVRKHYDSKNMQAIQSAAASMDAVWISVISSAPGKQGHVSAQEAQALTTSRGATPAHVVLDPSGDLGRLYEAKTTPHMFVITDQGMLAYAGAIDSIPSANPADIPRARNYVLEAANAVAAGDEVATKQTKPYGCSVKY